LIARFYVKPAGRKPAREWILELPEADRRPCARDIARKGALRFEVFLLPGLAEWVLNFVAAYLPIQVRLFSSCSGSRRI